MPGRRQLSLSCCSSRCEILFPPLFSAIYPFSRSFPIHDLSTIYPFSRSIHNLSILRCASISCTSDCHRLTHSVIETGDWPFHVQVKQFPHHTSHILSSGNDLSGHPGQSGQSGHPLHDLAICLICTLHNLEMGE